MFDISYVQPSEHTSPHERGSAQLACRPEDLCVPSPGRNVNTEHELVNVLIIDSRTLTPPEPELSFAQVVGILVMNSAWPR